MKNSTSSQIEAGKRRRNIKDVRRQQLIDATIESIARRGFADTTLAHVADGAGLSHGIVNFYFKSKDDLLVATLRHMTEDYEASWRAAVERAGPSPTTALDAMIETDFDPTVASRKKVTVWYAFWGEARWRPRILRPCVELSDRYFVQTRALIAEIVAAGGYRNVDCDVVARGLNAMVDGLWLDILINPTSVTRAEAKRTCRAFLAAHLPAEFAAGAAAASAA